MCRATTPRDSSHAFPWLRSSQSSSNAFQLKQWLRCGSFQEEPHRILSQSTEFGVLSEGAGLEQRVGRVGSRPARSGPQRPGAGRLRGEVGRNASVGWVGLGRAERRSGLGGHQG